MQHTPRKRFSQNFLEDRDVIARILDAIAPREGDQIVEIGPGKGALTRGLLTRARRLDVVELDRDLAASLPARLGHPAGLRVHSADALAFDFSSLAGEGESLRLVGNLPYNITSPLLFHLLSQRACIHDMHFTLQAEVVERLAAAPGTRAYGRLSIMTQLVARVENLFSIEPQAFSPPPRVRSAVVRLSMWTQPPVTPRCHDAFDALIRQAFSQRRKALRNSLRCLLAEDQIRAAGVDPGARPETLDLRAFAALADELSRQPHPP